MPKILRTIVWVIAMGMLFPSFSPHPARAMEDTIIAIVNDDVITLKDLKDFMNTAIVQMKMENSSSQEIENRIMELENTAVEKLIEEKLILTAAKEKGVEVNPKAIDDRLADIKGRYASEQEFLSALLADGATVTDLRDKIAAQLKIKFLVDEEVRAKIMINPQDITDYYHRNKSLFQEQERLEMETLLIPFAQDKAASRQKGEEALKRVQSGTPLSEAAQELLLTVTKGSFERGQLQSSIEEVLFKLKAGEISPLLETENGYAIFSIKNKWPPKVTPLEEVKDQIQDTLFRQKFSVSFSSWISKLKEKAFVEIKG